MNQEAFASVICSETARRDEICSIFGESYDPARWNDWRWQMRHRLTRLEQFEKLLQLTEAERRGLLLACAAGRAIWHLLPDDCRRVIELAEEVHGLAGQTELHLV